MVKIYQNRAQNTYIMQIKDDERFKRLKDYFKHPDAIKAIEIMNNSERKRFKDGTYNREGIDDTE